MWGCTIVNTARKEVVDEAGLVKILKSVGFCLPHRYQAIQRRRLAKNIVHATFGTPQKMVPGLPRPISMLVYAAAQRIC